MWGQSTMNHHTPARTPARAGLWPRYPPAQRRGMFDSYDAATAPLVMRGRAEVTRFFDGCALVPPGVVYLTQWRRGASALAGGGTRWAYAGIGIT
jgi:S-adenosyl methyltransferase